MLHPVLAVLARLTAGVAVVFLALHASWLIVPPGGDPWFGRELFDRVTTQPTAGDLWGYAQNRLLLIATDAAVGAGWLLAAGLLRRAAAGKLRLAGAGGGWVAGAGPVGLAAATAGVVLAVAVWVAPAGERWVALRLKDAVDPPARTGRFVFEMRTIGASFGRNHHFISTGTGRDEPPGWAELHRRLFDAVREEAFRLLASVLPWSVLFCLSGVVYCLTRPHPDADP